MKRILIIWTSALLMVFGAASCEKFFDPIPGEQYDLENTFTDRLKTEQFLNNVYSYVPDETNERDSKSIWTAGSIEGDITWSGNFATDGALGISFQRYCKLVVYRILQRHFKGKYIHHQC